MLFSTTLPRRAPRRLSHRPRQPEDCLDAGSSARLTDDAEARGEEIIHLHEDTWHRKEDIVKARLLARLGRGTTRIYARKTKACAIDVEEARAFLDEHHLWSSTNAKYAYGLHLNDTRVAVATFTKRKLVKRSGMDPRRTHELLRFCARRDTRVVGGITKLLKAFTRDRQVDDFVTNIDRDWGGEVRRTYPRRASRGNSSSTRAEGQFILDARRGLF